MGKLKLTESQISMLQALEDQLQERKVVKITAEQYSRLFEGDDGFQYNMGPKALKPSTKITKNFKRYGKDVPDSDMKFEGAINEQGPTDLLDFGQQIIRFLKGLLTDPSNDRVTSFWRKLDVTKDQLEDRMFELGMIGHRIINGKKIIKIMKHDFHENIKTLYNELVPQNEGMVQMGDDIELEETGEKDAVKRAFTEPFKKKGEKPSPEAIKAKIEANRKAELKRREAEKNRPIGEDGGYPAGTANDPSAPWNQVDPNNARQVNERPFDLLLWHQETAIFEKDGQYFAFNVEGTEQDEYSEYADREETPLGRDEDGDMMVDYGEWEMSEDIIEAYVNDNYKHLSFGKGYDDYEEGVDMVQLDQSMIDEMLATAKYIKNPKVQQNFISVLKNLAVSEVTAAAGSSGAFVGKMGSMPIQRGLSPAKALEEDDIDEASKKKKRAKAQQMKQQQADVNKPVEKKGGLKMTQFSDQEIWDAMRGNVQKDRKKEKSKYAGRKDKHKGKKFNEITEDYDIENDKLDGLKYKNFQHPTLGVFYIDKIHDKNEDDNKITYSVALKRENGPSESELFYSYDKKTGRDELIFNHQSEIIKNAYDMFDELYALVFDGVKEALRPSEDLQEQGIVNSGQYATPGFASSEFFGNKGKKGKAPVNKGVTHKKTMYPKGKMVKVSESQMEMIKKLIIESNNQTDTTYPEGGFVELDDCTKLNNNKEAQNGGCSVGAVDNVVKTKKTKDSVISDDAVYSEVAKKTGRTIAEVKKLIQSRKG